jgi:tellurite resistance protein TehA-like permease
MSAWLIALVGLIYAGISCEQFIRSDPRMGIVFAGYAFSNIGLWLMAK